MDLRHILQEEGSLVCPSLLAADFSCLSSAIAQLGSELQCLHLDVMDGNFVPNLTMGPALVKALRPHTDAVFDVHLMCAQPEKWFEVFAEAGADTLVFHQEASVHTQLHLQRIRELGLVAGIALNPGTALSSLAELLPWVDLILLMTVNPGFGGQSFIPEMLSKIQRAQQMIEQSGREIMLQVDGGINLSNAPQVYAAGARLLVAGSSVFAQADSRQALRALKLAVQGVR